jgi:predicted DNA repair protein MutK
MAGTSLLALLDDIATLLDDVGAMTKVATKRTAGMLGDELALYSKEVSGVRSHRELAVVWEIAKGSLRNKAILLPAALATSALAPWAILPLMIVAGTYLCYEGFEKVAEKLGGLLGRESHVPPVATESHGSPQQAEAAERLRVRGAIRTDLVLSIEIFVITLNVVEGATLTRQALTLAIVAALATIFVYGLVAGIVRLDEAGAWLYQRPGPATRKLGSALLGLAPRMMRALGALGTLAMFLVGGEILAHALPWLEERVAVWVEVTSGVTSYLVHAAVNCTLGLLAGAFAAGALGLGKRLRRK